MLSGTSAGGVVLLAYGVTIVAASIVWRRARGVRARGWRVIAITLVALAVEKAMHVETLVLRRAEGVALAGGWYGHRTGPQLWAIGALAAVALMMVAVIAWSLRRAGSATRIAATSTLLIAAFVLIRAVSFHRIDRLLATGIGPLRASNVVELAGLGIIGVCAWAVARADTQIGGG